MSAAGVVETLVESGAKSQSDKRFATSWTNLIKDIEKAAKLAYAHGSKPSTLSDEEWALVLSHRSRSTPRAPAEQLKKKVVATKKPVARRTRTRSSASPAAPEAVSGRNGKAAETKA